MNKPTKPRRGAPPKPPEERYRTPMRCIGRVADETWEEIQAGYARSGDKTFTAWAVEALLEKARKPRDEYGRRGECAVCGITKRIFESDGVCVPCRKKKS